MVATTTLSSDDAINDYCFKNNINVARGDCNDVLARFGDVIRSYNNYDVVVRVTGDCPLIGYDTVDEVVLAHFKNGADYTCNTSPYSRAEGQDVEVMSRDLLLRADKCAKVSFDREHVTPWIKCSEKIYIQNYMHSICEARQEHWSVDHIEDLEFARDVWKKLNEKPKVAYCYQEIVEVARNLKKKKLSRIVNEGYYRSIYDEASADLAKPLSLIQSEKLLEKSEKSHSRWSANLFKKLEASYSWGYANFSQKG